MHPPCLLILEWIYQPFRTFFVGINWAHSLPLNIVSCGSRYYIAGDNIHFLCMGGSWWWVSDKRELKCGTTLHFIEWHRSTLWSGTTLHFLGWLALTDWSQLLCILQQPDYGKVHCAALVFVADLLVFTPDANHAMPNRRTSLMLQHHYRENVSNVIDP